MDGSNEPAPFLWLEDGKEQAITPRTRKWTKKKKEFLGWGSRQLIEFLGSIGKETEKAISQHDVTEIINKYVNENNLIHPEKKKKVLCDDRLLGLFGRKAIFRNKIYDLLEAHLAENQLNSDDDLFYSSDEKEEQSVRCKKPKVSGVDRKTQPKKKAAEVPKSSLAAIISENIKPVYLKRSLIQELVKQPETFEGKVVGSFVRIKSDPLDVFQKNSHQLELVTGVKAGDAANAPTILQISGVTSEISIKAISEDNFSEEECEDLHRRVKDGLIKQPTVGELEQKVEVLHQDITKHWLSRELALLKNLIDRANEKGWRHRVTEYLDKRKLLQTPSEQARLLSEIPKVKAELQVETIPDGPPDGVNQSTDDSPKVTDWDWEPCYGSAAKGAATEVSTKQDAKAQIEIGTRSNGDAQCMNPQEVSAFPEAEATRAESNGHVRSYQPEDKNFSKTEAVGVVSNSRTQTKILSWDHTQIYKTEETGGFKNGHVEVATAKATDVCGTESIERKQVQVIDLSDEDEEEPKVMFIKKPIPNPLEELMWYYIDPQENYQGPFSLASLKRWRDADYFPPHFRVWKAGQSPKEAVLLSDILRQTLSK